MLHQHMRNPPDIKAATHGDRIRRPESPLYCALFRELYGANLRTRYLGKHVLGGNIQAYFGTDKPSPSSSKQKSLTISEKYMVGHFRRPAESRARRGDKRGH